MISKVFAAVIKGIEAVPVTIETDISRGMPGFVITGLADATVKEAAVRVHAAIVNSGYRFPNGRISINIAPAGMRKRGSALDLGIAKQEGRNTLGVVFHYRFRDVVLVRAVTTAIVFRPQAGHQADTAQIERPILERQIIIRVPARVEVVMEKKSVINSLPIKVPITIIR